MKHIRDIALFVIANGLGFLSVSFVYVIAVQIGMITPESVAENITTFQGRFMSGTMIVWTACALISLTFLFMSSKIRIVFLLLPLILPAIYGFSVLAGFESAPPSP